MKDSQKITISLKDLRKLVKECRSVSESAPREPDKTRIFRLGLTANPNAAQEANPDAKAGVGPMSIIEAFRGQLSDGLWENSRAMEKWWEFAKPGEDSGETVWIASDTYQNIYGGMSRTANPYIDLDEKKFREWLANHLKMVVQEEVGKKGWDRDSERELSYFRKGTTVAMVYAVYDILKMRPDKNKNKYYDAFQA